MNPQVKQGLRSLLSWSLIVFLLPQLFLICYYFPHLVRRQGNWLAFMGAIARYGLTISWVSLPFLTLIYVGVRVAFTRRIHGMAIWAISAVIGYAWVASWNLAVYPTFKWLNAIIPVILCSAFPCAYAIGLHLYKYGATMPDAEDLTGILKDSDPVPSPEKPAVPESQENPEPPAEND